MTRADTEKLSPGTPVVRQASSPDDLEAVRRLMRAFVEWHLERHVRDRNLIERYFDPQYFNEELAALPGSFALPSGRLLVALDGTRVAGCGALQDLGGGICEMKRLFVDPAFHGRGLGRQLAEQLIAEAKNIGYRTMRLDTGPLQHEAQGLYRRLGFRTVDCYYETDRELRDWLVFMEKDLVLAA